MAIKKHPFEDAERRGRVGRRIMAAGIISLAVLGVGGVGYIYIHNNTASVLTRKGELALVQHDAHGAVTYLTRAVNKNPGGELGVKARNLLSKALIEDGREADARTYVSEVLAGDAKNADALRSLADSYVHPAVRRYWTAIRPLSVAQAKELFAMIESGLSELGKLPRTSINVVAMAELQRLYDTITTQGKAHAQAEIDVATLAGDQTAINVARQDIQAFPEEKGARTAKAMALLQEAWKIDPQATDAPRLIAQYEFEDGHFKEALDTYRTVQKNLGEKGVPQALAITAADAVVADASAEPDIAKRDAAAQGVLEEYLKEFPYDWRVIVAVGQMELLRGDLVKAAEMAQQAIGKPDADVDARILLVDVRIDEKKTSEALKLLEPLLAKYSGTPEVWYRQGEANGDLGNFKEAEDAFRKASTLNPNYTAAKRAMLTYQIRGGNSSGALLTAKDLLTTDRFFMTAWSVVTQDLRDHGEGAQAKKMLQALAADKELPATARVDLATLLLQANAPDDAEQLIGKIDTKGPERKRLEAQLAETRGNTAEARALMAKAVAAEPENVVLRIEYVGMLAGAGLAADARAQLDDAAKRPMTPDEAIRLGREYLDLRLPDAAEAIIKPVLADHPGLADAVTLQNNAEAMRTGKEVYSPGSAAATAAEALRQANEALDAKDGQKALSSARQGLSLTPTSGPLHLAAGRALAMLGKADQGADEIVTAATANPDEVAAFSAFVDVFSGSPEMAEKGMSVGARLQGVNAALGAWVMGKLSEVKGDVDGARKNYVMGIEATSRLVAPRNAKDVLYTSLITLEAKRKDSAAVRKTAETYAAQDAYFAAALRMLATDRLLELRDMKGAEAELDALTNNLSPDASPRIILGVVQRRVSMGRTDEALALLKKRTESKDADPQLVTAYASLLQADHPEEALKLRQELVARDPGNPQYQVALAEALAGQGDVPGALAALDAASKLGETGKVLASSARLRYFISTGLVKAAENELATAASQKDFASLLAVGRSWEELKNDQQAKAALEKIPSYAAEYPAAQIALAGMISDAGDPAAGAKALEALSNTSASARQQASVPLFHTLLAAGQPEAAALLAQSQQSLLVPGTGEWRVWTLLAAMAQREGKDYDGALKTIASLDNDTRKASALDIALIELLEHKPGDTADLPDDAPAFNKTFVTLENGGKGGAREAIAGGNLSVVIAALASMPAADRTAALSAAAKNSGVLVEDLRTMLTEAGDSADSGARLMTLALAERVQEAGWSTAALDTLDALAKQTGTAVTTGLIIRHQALTTLKKTADADKVRDTLAARFKQGPMPPTVRILLAASWSKEGKFADALAILQPLTDLQRPDVLTSIATLQEKLGHFDEAIAMHRHIRELAPDDIVTANNLAYTLMEAHPTDKAALAEAKKNIDFAISKAPQVTVFQDTLGWIEIQSGDAAAGTKRIARVLPSLHLDPAVHYHLGVGYARLGEKELARMNLEDVATLSAAGGNKTPGPEVAMASEALKGLQ